MLKLRHFILTIVEYLQCSFNIGCNTGILELITPCPQSTQSLVLEISSSNMFFISVKFDICPISESPVLGFTKKKIVLFCSIMV